MRSEAPAGSVDILDILLTAPQSAPIPEQEALARLIRRANAPAGPTTKTTMVPKKLAKTSPARPARKKVKTTQYLDATVNERLAEARDMLAEEHKSICRLSKSRIVETALRYALDDLEARGPHSELSRALETSTATACTPEVP